MSTYLNIKGYTSEEQQQMYYLTYLNGYSTEAAKFAVKRKFVERKNNNERSKSL